ncbi:5-carboxymethyl-2-hydroxymuconate Delta-isomerase [Mesorhizobium sp. VK9D]|uniref:5-carboxymethyl-2-hydroxymuconate Delta-isomerase n=1 Tax=Mesorhizobium australafricanum TaxID=3072311 RepID=UPI002A23E970|nr:5-carboxymethyl-2-hydroxymuconate Delta-isomerase [Mesorhizobium sp. VK9D]MDX8452232.1 5-carboxymethyl-2-hydroxymuconate Delta-isomerase [Mesorhizobium sp. VK9D]
MPHMSIEYSANLDPKVDMGELCALVSRAILDTGLFEPGAVRVRAFRAEAYAIADRLPENGFLDMNFRIGKGRGEEEKKSAGEAIFAEVADHLSSLFATPHFALSLEIREIDAELSWKKNAIHPRLRGK